MKIRLLAAATAAAFALGAQAQAETLKIGYITTLSGPAGIIGKDMKNAVDLAYEQLGGKIGGMDAEIIYGDDQRKPDVAKQVANKLIKSDRVNFVSGVIWSNVMMAIHKQVTRQVIFVGSNAGPSPIAGKRCSENYFSTSWQNDQTPEAMGKYLQDNKIDNVYLIAPNYQAGKDMIAGVKRYYKGTVAGEVYTKLGQQDYQVELSQLRAKKPAAVFIFLPGGMGIKFLKQYEQAGLRAEIPLYNVFSTDNITLKPQGAAALGALHTSTWSADLDNALNKKFVEGYRAKYGKTPSFYGAQAYDSIMLIDQAVRRAGSLDTDKVRRAMRLGFDSTRGTLKFNTNQFPIQNFYMRQVEKTADGGLAINIKGVVFENYGDNHAKDCGLRW